MFTMLEFTYTNLYKLMPHIGSIISKVQYYRTTRQNTHHFNSKYHLILNDL